MILRKGEPSPSCRQTRREAHLLCDDESVTEQISAIFAPESVSLCVVSTADMSMILGNKQIGVLIINFESVPGESLELILRLKGDSCTILLLAEKGNMEEASRHLDHNVYDTVSKPLDRISFSAGVFRALERQDFLCFKRDYRQMIEDAIEERTIEISRRKDFLTGILNSSTLVSVVLTDLDQNVLFWNKGAENIFGYSAEEMIGSKITRLYPSDSVSADTVKSLQSSVYSGKETVHGRMRQIAKDGRILNISLAISPMLDRSGRIEGILGIGQDVTEAARLHDELVKSFHSLKETQDVTIFALAGLAESRDSEIGGHLLRIKHYSRALCEKLAENTKFSSVLTAHFIEDLVRSSVLHDIGKVGIPDSVLLHPGKFNSEQFETMKRHPIVGGNALAEAAERLGTQSFLTVGKEIAYYHHERWDGTGYPFGLRGEDIPISARIVALADVYDALTTRRRYKEPLSHHETCRHIAEGRGIHFDPDLVDAFFDIQEVFESISSRYGDK